MGVWCFPLATLMVLWTNTKQCTERQRNMVRDIYIYICTIVHGTCSLLLSICSMCCNYSHDHVICVLYISNIFRRKLSSAVNQRTNQPTNRPTDRPTDRQEQFLRLKTTLVPMLLVSPHSRINQSAIWCIVGITA